MNQIPKKFIQTEQQLKGIVREISDEGVIKVEHQPIIKIPFCGRRGARWPSDRVDVHHYTHMDYMS